MEDQKVEIINKDGDFFICQNYILQLVADGKLSDKALRLYLFYRSMAGFPDIHFRYDYISLNTGMSRATISRANQELVRLGLIKLKGPGSNVSYKVFLKPNSKLPRRKLYKDDDEEEVKMEPAIDWNEDAKDNKLTPEYEAFLQAFKDEWCSRTGAKCYTKNDLSKILKIKDPIDAKRYISTLWYHVDDWIAKSDRTLSVFVHAYSEGKLQAFYPKTTEYYREQTLRSNERQNHVS